MSRISKAGRIATIVFLSLALWAGGPAWSQSLFLSPDTVRISSGASEAFQLELRADNAVSGMSLYSVRIAFDKTLLVVDSVKEGPLLYTCGATVPFYARYNADSTDLIIESLIIWPRCSVNGPGLLATMYMRNIGSGALDCKIDSIEVADVNNNIIPGITGKGSMLYLNAPPASFDLLQPTSGQIINVEMGEAVAFTWERSMSFYPGDNVRYDLIVSQDAGFPPAQTLTYSNIADTSKTIGESSLWDGSIYWKVRAYSAMYGFSRYCRQPYLQFTLNIAKQPPSTFALLTPRDDSLLNVIQKASEYFDWVAATSVLPNDTLKYSLYIGRGNTFPGSEDFIVPNLALTETTVDIDSFDLNIQYYWQVKCTNRLGLFSWSDHVFGMKFYMRGDANADGTINVGDAVYIINFIFKDGPAPTPDIAGDTNCDDTINVGDAVAIINYIFKGGDAPCSQ